MQATNLFSRTVPCKKELITEDTSAYLGTETYSIMKNSLLRISPNGTLAISGKTINSVLFLDNEMVELLQQPTFTLNGMPRSVVQNLLSHELIEQTDRPNSFKKVHCLNNALPYYGRIEITDACQCDCDICYKAEIPTPPPSLDILKKRIKHLRKLGITRLEILGGEPLLRKDLPKLCDFVTKENFLYTIVTNGEYLSSLDKRAINSLKSASDVIISIDSYGELHDKSRKRPGLFAKDIEGIQVLKENGINCSLLCTVNQDNEPGIDQLVEYLKPFEVNLFIRPTIIAGAAANNELQNVDMRRIYEKHKNNPHVFHNTVHLADKIPESKYYGCDIRQLINIDVNGRLLICHMDRKHKKGPIEKYTPEMLLQELDFTLRSRLKKQETCKDCDVNNSSEGIKCGGFCQFSNTFIKNKIKEC